jgi:hypothetical protein
MSEHAIKIEGFDEFTHLPVRIQLTLVTNDEPESGAVATGFAAPRGFLPDQFRPVAHEFRPVAHVGSTVHSTILAHDRAQHSRHTGLTSCQAQVWGGGAGRGGAVQ